MDTLTAEQIKALDDDNECPDCGDQDVIATSQAPEEYVCESCGWHEYVEAVNAMRGDEDDDDG